MEIGVSPLFRDVSEESQQAMRTCFDMREYSFRTGEVIYDFSEGRNMVGVLTQGAAVIERIDHQGSRTILERLERGGVFGEMLMFENVAGDSITVVAEELWMTAVTHRPKKKPLRGLSVSLLRIFCSWPPACFSSALPMMSIPNKNRARPPSSEKTLKMVISVFLTFLDVFFSCALSIEK